MKNSILLILFLCFSVTVFSQTRSSTNSNSANNPRTNKGQDEFSSSLNAPKEKPPINLYKIISYKRDTTYVDTTLKVSRMYAFNYLHKDNFELLPFANVGQTYNRLVYNFQTNNLLPLFAAQAHHYNFMEIEDIYYYHVPTPLSEMYFKTAFKQGQQLDAFLTVNTSKQFNFSVAYKGLRSLGAYQNSLTSTGNFRFTTNYHSKNNRYNIRAHLVAQDILNRENGGLQESSIPLFVNDDPDFKDRGRLDVNFEDAKNLLKGFRVYFDQEFQVFKPKDSIVKNQLTIGNSLTFEDKSYVYTQTNPFDAYGETYVEDNLRSRVNLETFTVKGYARYKSLLFGEFAAFVGYDDYNYGYNSVLYLDATTITNRLKGTSISTGASYKKQYKGFQLFGDAAINISGDFDAQYIQAGASYHLNKKNNIEASLHIHSVAPNFNYLLFQNDYKNYNWQNTHFNNVKTQALKLKLKSASFFDATLSYSGIDDYTYFAIKTNDSTPTPHQNNDRVDVLKVKLEREFRYRKFALANTVMYQKVLSGKTIMNLPEIVTRQTIYYHDDWFKKAMYMQTGVSIKYFTKYNANGYDPVLAEFYTQNKEEIGGFPLIDIFFSAKVRQARIYFKYEHFNALFGSKNNYFSAPGYPYRDAVIRFGLVWNFFM